MSILFGGRLAGLGDLGEFGGSGQALLGSGMPLLVVDTKGGLPLTSGRWVGGDLGDRAVALGDLGDMLELAAVALGDRECDFATGCWFWEDLGDWAAVLGDKKGAFAVGQWVADDFGDCAAALGNEAGALENAAAALGDAPAGSLEGAAAGAEVAGAGSNAAVRCTVVPSLTASLGNKAAAISTCIAADGTLALGMPRGITSLSKRPDLHAFAERLSQEGWQSSEALP